MSDEQHQAMLDDVAVYALGAMPAADAARVRAHLATCERCREEYDSLAPVAAGIGVSAETGGDAADCPGTLLKPRIMRIVRGEAAAADAAPAPRARAPVWPAYLVAAACFAIALFSGISNITLTDQLRQSRAELARVTQRASLLARNLSDERTTIAELMSADAKHYAGEDGEVITRGSHLYVAMHDLPEPPHGKVYQAWVEAKGSKRMDPSVTFVPDSHGVAVIALPADARNTVAVAISVEPEGGSEQPTSKPVLVVSLT